MLRFILDFIKLSETYIAADSLVSLVSFLNAHPRKHTFLFKDLLFINDLIFLANLSL